MKKRDFRANPQILQKLNVSNYDEKAEASRERREKQEL